MRPRRESAPPEGSDCRTMAADGVQIGPDQEPRATGHIAGMHEMIQTLIDKGFASRRKDGKAYFYKALSRRSSLFGQAMQRMAEIFTGGSKAGLILELLRREKLSAEELAALQEIAGNQQPKS